MKKRIVSIEKWANDLKRHLKKEGKKKVYTNQHDTNFKTVQCQGIIRM